MKGKEIKANPHSSIVDIEFTHILRDNMAKAVSWDDNEWGYSCRAADLAEFMGQRLS
jgi:glyceraldehyde 3-phosphate dehydrogenase